MTSSTHLNLPFILPAQAGKHITHNEALAALDVVTQLAVLDRDLSVPPASPADGDRYIVGMSPTGLWAGKTNQVAAWGGGGWTFHAPKPGWIAFVLDEAGLLVWTGLSWVPTIGLDGSAPKLGINTAADAANRLSVKSEAVLVSHDDVTPGSGDARLKLNKAGSTKTASLLFQTGYSGRAEFGTAGDDQLHVKVSPDGSTWREALVVDPTTGRIGIGHASPIVALDVNGPIRAKSYTVAGVPDAAAAAGQVIYVSNETGGATLAFSDGADWRRVTDRAVIA